MGTEQSKEDQKNNSTGLRGMVFCGQNFPCGGCINEVDNQGIKMNTSQYAPLDAQGQLTQPMKDDVQSMIRNQKNQQWDPTYDRAYGRIDPRNIDQYEPAPMRSEQFGVLQSPDFNQNVPISANYAHHAPEAQQFQTGDANDPQDKYIFQNQLAKRQESPNAKDERKQMIQQIADQGKAQTLQLRVLSSAHLEKDFTLLVNPLGIVPAQQMSNYDQQAAIQGYENGPRRGEFDGYTYFGAEDVYDDEDNDSFKDGAGTTGGYIEDSTGRQVLKKEMNDFIIPANTQNDADASKEQPSINMMMGGGANQQGRQFYIQFDPFDRKYKIRDLGKGYGAFGKLQGQMLIRDSFLINIGESYIVSYLISDSDQDPNPRASPAACKLKLKIFPPDNLDNPDVVVCQSGQQKLVLGRSANCDIRIDDQLISKMQSTIKYQDGQWVIEDGRDGKESTNGTWYYLNQEEAIQDGMVFKQNQTFFVANLI